MDSINLLSYNIGHLYLLKRWRHLPIGKTNKVFFDRNDLDHIKSIVQKTKPDIIFFQELTSTEDAKFLAQKLWFSHSSFFKSSHLKSQNLGTGILYNNKNGTIKTESWTLSIHSLIIGDCLFTNVHLNPFYKSERAEQIKEFISYIQKYPKMKHIVAGDFNISKRKKWRLNKVDKQSYTSLTKHLHDATSSIISTHRLWYKYDYIFASKWITTKQASCIPQLHWNMDHYPIYGTILATKWKNE